jgi:hypothetical protein
VLAALIQLGAGLGGLHGKKNGEGKRWANIKRIDPTDRVLKIAVQIF